MRFASIGSGSYGNATIIQGDGVTVLLDCGFSYQELCSRLAVLQLEPGAIDHILVTHEHSDHIGGVGVVARKTGAKVWMTAGTWRKVEARLGAIPDLEMLNCHAPLVLNGLEISPYPVPHDAAEPCQYVFGDGQARFGVLTDTGSTTPLIEKELSGCDALLLEYNHDRDMLLQGEYPWSVKQRIDSAYGHMNNQVSAGLLRRLDRSRLKHVVAAHLSEKNNCPDLVRTSIAAVLEQDPEQVEIASQGVPSKWFYL